jgi:hypothetical protein
MTRVKTPSLPTGRLAFPPGRRLLSATTGPLLSLERALTPC